MKKIASLILGLIVSASVIGQTVAYTDLTNPNQAKLNGVFNFTFDSHFTADALTKASAYYTDKFTVDYVQTTNGHTATITMVDDNNIARKTIERYFATLGVQNINIDDSSLEVRPFLAKFVMLPRQ